MNHLYENIHRTEPRGSLLFINNATSLKNKEQHTESKVKVKVQERVQEHCTNLQLNYIVPLSKGI